MLRSIFIVAAACCTMALIPGNKTYPQGYFALPLDRSIKLSATFGDLRSNHFHAGIDIKTADGQPGEKVLASAAGYVSRIKVEPGGYGHALYIAHPNGYTSVYAHLDSFTENIEAYVKDQQYARKRFSVDLNPGPGAFKVAAGEHIGYLGNSGGSTGPHLHFEIRESAGQIPVNPLHFGLPLADNIPPQMRALKVYYLDQDLRRFFVKTYPLISVANDRFVVRDTLTEGAWRVAFGLKVDDRMNGAINRYGIYSLRLSADDSLLYAFEMDNIPFSVTRYLNSHIDYQAKQQGQGYYHRCYKLPGNALDIYTPDNALGVLPLYSGKTQQVIFTAADHNGNTSELTIYVKRDTAMRVPEEHLVTNPIVYNQPGLILATDFTMTIDPGTFYENVDLHLQSISRPVDGGFAGRYMLGPEDIPLHKYADVSIRYYDIPGYLLSKAFVGILEDNELTSCGGTVHGTTITAGTRELGTYTIGIDTIPPSINARRFSSNMAGYSSMSFDIRDSQPTTGRARGLRYTATVDGDWILMEYDAKSHRITHSFDGRIAPGTHTLHLEVIDDRNNTAVLERTFSL